MERVNRILEFVNKGNNLNNSSKQANNDNSNINKELPTQQTPAAQEPILPDTQKPSTPDPFDINNFISDDKKYNSLRRKLRAAKSFPCNIMGKAFYTKDDVNTYLDVLKDNKRIYNKNKKSEAVKNTKLNTDDLEAFDDDNNIEEEGYVYSTKKPVGIVKDNKKYKLPSTNKRDRKKIFDEVKDDKSVVNKLLTSNNDDEFNNITLQSIKNQDTLRRTRQHLNNDISRDNTWNKNEFIKLMEQMMDDASEDEPQQKQYYSTLPELDEDEPYVMPRSYGFNPKLFR